MWNTNGNKKVTVHFIRHGKTKWNEERRYLGRTDQELSVAGWEELKSRKYPKVQIVFSSPYKRCLQSAKCIYPEIEPIIIPQWREMNFGIFEGKTYEELKDTVEYKEWLSSGGEALIVGGESKAQFIERVMSGFQEFCKRLTEYLGEEEIEEVAVVVHGGCIMAIASTVLSGDYYDYQIKNGEMLTITI